MSSLHQKLEGLETAIKIAFSKIKKDIAALQRQRVDIDSLRKSLKEEIVCEIMQRTEQRKKPEEDKEVISKPL